MSDLLSYFMEEAKNIASMLDYTEFPQLYDFLTAFSEAWEDVESPYDLATKLMKLDAPKDFPDFVTDYIYELYQAAITNGNAEAMNDLGAHYYDGYRGFEQDFEIAVEYYTMAAENGSRQAQENLGYCYYYGRSVDQDYEKAFHYFALGAFDGHLISLYKIGDMYLNGYYVKQNLVEAFHIFIRCIRTMSNEAQQRVAGPVYLRLGRMFLEGLGAKKDLMAALSCYQKAEYYLYDMVQNGIGGVSLRPTEG